MFGNSTQVYIDFNQNLLLSEYWHIEKLVR